MFVIVLIWLVLVGWLVGYALDVFQLLPHAPGSLFSSARCWKAVLQLHPHDRCRNAVFLSKVSKTLLPLGDVNTHELHNADPLLRIGSVIVIILIWLVVGWLQAGCYGLEFGKFQKPRFEVNRNL